MNEVDIVRPKAGGKSTRWKIELRQDWCKGCYFCLDICPVKGIFTRASEIGPRGFQLVEINPDGCTGCKLCELLCPDLAITVEEDVEG